MAENGNNAGAVLIGFAAGIVVGAGVALLLAPQSGKETRELLARKAGELKNDAETLVDDVLDKSKRALQEKKQQFEAAIEAGKAAAAEAKAQLKQSKEPVA